MTTSIWEGTSGEETTFPSLTDAVDTDVVIIGGGITGIMAAMLLTKGGKRVVVLEAKRVGSGSTGRSTGNLHVLPDQSLNLVRKKWGKETAALVAESREEAIRLPEFTVASYTVCYTVRSRRRSSPTASSDVKTDGNRSTGRPASPRSRGRKNSSRKMSMWRSSTSGIT